VVKCGDRRCGGGKQGRGWWWLTGDEDGQARVTNGCLGSALYRHIPRGGRGNALWSGGASARLGNGVGRCHLASAHEAARRDGRPGGKRCVWHVRQGRPTTTHGPVAIILLWLSEQCGEASARRAQSDSATPRIGKKAKGYDGWAGVA
jgi:hypothetical protein